MRNLSESQNTKGATSIEKRDIQYVECMNALKERVGNCSSSLAAFSIILAKDASTHIMESCAVVARDL